MQGKGKINAEGLELGILLCLLSRNKGLFSIAWLNWNAKICDTYFSIIILSFLIILVLRLLTLVKISKKQKCC